MKITSRVDGRPVVSIPLAPGTLIEVKPYSVTVKPGDAGEERTVSIPPDGLSVRIDEDEAATLYRPVWDKVEEYE